MSRCLQNPLALLLLTFWPGLICLFAQPPAPPDTTPARRLDLAGLGKLYKDLQLPLPPRDAGFASVGADSTPWRFQRDKRVDGRSLHLDFQYRFATENPSCKGQYLVWEGFQVKEMTRVEQFRATAPSPEAVLQVMKMDRLDGNFDPLAETEPIFAIQCHLLGHHELDKTTQEDWEKVRDFVQDEVDRRLELEKAK